MILKIRCVWTQKSSLTFYFNQFALITIDFTKEMIIASLVHIKKLIVNLV